MYKKRMQELSCQVQAMGIDVLLVDDPVHLTYLTGLHLSCGQLLVDKKGVAALLVDGRYYEKCRQDSPVPVSLATGFDSLKEFLESHTYTHLGFAREKTYFSKYQQLKELPIEVCPVDSPVATLRWIKDQEEIKKLKKAALLGKKGYEFVVHHLQVGVTERELATELEIFWRRAGGEALAFEPIIAFGPHTSMPHYHCGDVPLVEGVPVLIDIGVKVDGYCSDMTRVYFFGEVDSRIQQIYPIVEEAKEAALALCRPGVRMKELDRAARSVIEEAGFGEYFTHGLGHGVGLEVHEGPVVNAHLPHGEIPLVEGMVITIEPGIYLPGIGGVRLEDTVVIEKGGYENFYPTDFSRAS